MSKYRFKRIEEFREDELRRDGPIPKHWNGSMLKYLGTDIPEQFEGFCDRGEPFDYEGWHFSDFNYVRKPTSKKQKIDNTVIENTSEEHGKRIIRYFESLGIDTRDSRGLIYGPNRHVFYGVINGRFDNYNIGTVNREGASIIKLPEDQVSKTSDVVEYFEDLSQHVGRYLKALVDRPHAGSVKAGEIGLIISRSDVNFPSQSEYWCPDALSKGMLHVKYELMPKDYSPDLPSDSCVYDYVECINPSGWTHTVKANGGNLIFKTSDFDFSLHSVINTWTWGDVIKEYEGSSWVKSTKEKYEEQFITEKNKYEGTSIVEKTQPQSDVIHNHKTFIEPVHSIDLKLRTKNKSIKF